jgi:hypothetical protein
MFGEGLEWSPTRLMQILDQVFMIGIDKKTLAYQLTEFIIAVKSIIILAWAQCNETFSTVIYEFS